MIWKTVPTVKISWRKCVFCDVSSLATNGVQSLLESQLLRRGEIKTFFLGIQTLLTVFWGAYSHRMIPTAFRKQTKKKKKKKRKRHQIGRLVMWGVFRYWFTERNTFSRCAKKNKPLSQVCFPNTSCLYIMLLYIFCEINWETAKTTWQDMCFLAILADNSKFFLPLTQMYVVSQNIFW